MQKLRILNNNSFELFVKLFDSQVQPIAVYSAELWGAETKLFIAEKYIYCTEKVFRHWDANAKWPCPWWNKQVSIICELCSKMHTLLVKINENGGVQITKQSLEDVTGIRWTR